MEYVFAFYPLVDFFNGVIIGLVFSVKKYRKNRAIRVAALVMLSLIVVRVIFNILGCFKV